MANNNSNNKLQNEQKKIINNLSFQSIEAYKLLRTNIGYTIDVDKKCKIVGITSSTRGEGKSTLAINLSHVIAQDNQKVLLIDGDLRLPAIAKRLNIANGTGITDVLGHSSKDNSETPIVQFEPNFFVLTSGHIPPNPSEMLGGKRMDDLLAKLSAIFDYIIIDLPPVNIVSDPIAISKKLDGFVMCVRENYVLLREVKEAVNRLKLVDAHILGFVITSDNANEKKYGYRYRYRHYNGYRYSKYYKGYGYGSKKS